MKPTDRQSLGVVPGAHSFILIIAAISSVQEMAFWPAFLGLALLVLVAGVDSSFRQVIIRNKLYLSLYILISVAALFFPIISEALFDIDSGITLPVVIEVSLILSFYFLNLRFFSLRPVIPGEENTRSNQAG